MVSSYLEKLQSQFLEEKISLEKEKNHLQMKIKEITEFANLLEESSDPNYESFSPREINSKNKRQIKKLLEEEKAVKEQLILKEEEYRKCVEKIEELSVVIRQAKSDMMDNSVESLNDEVYRLALLETQENERQRISRDLHDSTVQNLTSLVHKAELCGKLVDMDPLRCKLELNIMSKTLREIINDTRQMIYNLRPMSFDDIGLDITIERTLEKLENSESRKINFSVIGEPYKIKPVIGITILRIIQEACNNAIKYANASFIKVVLQYQKTSISVEVLDDGIGFDSDKIDLSSKDDNSGFGLSMMKERVYLLSGKISIVSTKNDGTRIKVKVPIVE